MDVNGRSRHDPPPDDGPEERSLAWGWSGSIAVVALSVLVLGGALVRTPGSPDCYGYSMAGWVLFCPWARTFVANVTVILSVLMVALTVGGLLIGGVRQAVRR